MDPKDTPTQRELSFVCCISTPLFSEFSVVCRTNVIWFGVGKCFQDHWKKIPILVYIILVTITEKGRAA